MLIRLFGPHHFLCPSDSLYRKLLPYLDAQHLESSWLNGYAARCVPKPMTSLLGVHVLTPTAYYTAEANGTEPPADTVATFNQQVATR